MFRTLIAAAILATPAYAGDIMIMEPYARASSPTAKAGAAFMEIMNQSAQPDRLIAASSDIAARVELHTHKDLGDGVMKMMEVEGGIEIPADGSAQLARGGNHVMFMGLNQSFVQDETIDVTLTFENAGEITVTIPIDNDRMPKKGHGHGDHSGHDHSGNDS
ncbi:copper chaperone PCu(A)C [Roseobacteraceae bacterium S113]